MNNLSEELILKLYRKEDLTELYTDASMMGLACILFQTDGQNRKKLVYCVSRKTTENEINYHSSKLRVACNSVVY